MRKCFYLCLLGLIAILGPAQAFAADLLCAYQDALMSDPTFKAAQALYLADQENVPIARSALLPSLILQGNTTREHVSQQTAPFFGFPSTRFWNTSSLYTLDLTQPIFNYAAWSTLRQASFEAREAEANFAGSAQDLMIRTAQAYFTVLQASDTLRFTVMQREAVGRQLQQAQQQYEVGLIARTGASEARASYDTVVANEIAARNNLAVALEQLRAITGRKYATLIGADYDLPLVQPNPANIESWVRVSENQNYALRAAIEAANVAQENIKTQFAGHLPVINFISGYSYDRESNAAVTGFSTQRIASAGVSVNFPIFQGGLVNAETRQATYLYQQAIANMEVTHRNALTQARESYLNVISGISKVKADRQAVISAEIALEATTEGYKAGTRTMLDVLNGQTSLYQAQQSYSISQYQYLINILTLKEAAGTLSPNDLGIINCWLHTSVDIAGKLVGVYSLNNGMQSNVKKVRHIRTYQTRRHIELPIPEKTTTSKQLKSPFRLKTATLLQMQNNYFTLQLFDSAKEQHAIDFIKQHHLHHAHYFRSKNHAGVTYHVIEGNYATKRKAQAAANQLPAEFEKMRPWIRSWKEIKKAVF